MKVLDLFSGLKGWSQPFENRGHEVFSVDIDERFDADLHKDITELRHTDIPWHPDIILASPPCEAFSVASISHHWGGGWRKYQPKTKHAENSMVLVQRTVDFITTWWPAFWVIENPRGVLRKLGIIPEWAERETVTYCQYGETRMKPTDLWGGFPPSLRLRPMCKNGDPCHERAPRGAKTGTQGLKGAMERAKIPYQLALDVCLAAEKDLND